MRTLCKKALALCVVFALALTCFVGTLSVSAADPYDATITVADVAIDQGTTSVDVVLNITAAEPGINEAIISVSSDLGSIAAEPKLTSFTATDNGDAYVDVVGDDFSKIFLSARKAEDATDLNGITAAAIKFTFDVAADKAVGDYAINIATDGVKAADKNETVVNFVYEGAKVTVVAPHVHNVVWTSDKAGNHTSSCDAEGCKGFEAATEACADGEDEDLLCDKCGYDLTPAEPECEHENATSVVTTRPTKDTTGLRTFTCECGETWTEEIPVAVLKSATDGETYKLGHNLDLQSSIEIAFRFRNAFVDEAVSVYAYIEKDIYDVNGAVEDTAIFETQEFVVASSSRKAVYYNGVKSTEMGTVVRAEFYRELADGTFEYVIDNYSIADYATTTLTNPQATAAMKTLVVDLLNYGTAAQLNFDYNLGNLVNEDFEAYADLATKVTPTPTNCADRIDNANKEIRLGRALDLASSICIISELKTADNKAGYTAIDGLCAKYSYVDVNGVTKTGTIDTFAVSTASKNYMVKFDLLTALEFASPVTIGVYRGETLVSDTIVYSIDSYATSVFKNEKPDAEMYKLMEAILKYGASAKAAL